MEWTCENCFATNRGKFCVQCGGKPSSLDSEKTVFQISSESVPNPENYIENLLQEKVERGEVSRKQLDAIDVEAKRLRLNTQRLENIYSKVRESVLSHDFKMILLLQEKPKAGKMAQLRFEIKNLSGIDYTDTEIVIEMASSKEKLREKKFPLLSGESQQCYVSYKAPLDWQEDRIKQIRLYLRKEGKVSVFKSIREYLLKIESEENRAINVHIQDASGVIVDNRLQDTFFGKQEDERITIDLLYDAEETDLQGKTGETVFLPSKHIAPYEICYLKIEEPGEKTRYVYLIAKPSVQLGRSSRGDIQLYYLDSRGDEKNQNTYTISKEHCRILYEKDSIQVQDIGSSSNHNFTKIKKEKKDAVLQPKEIVELLDSDTIQIGYLELIVALYQNANQTCIQKEEFGYRSPGKYSCLRLRYLNNPNHDEQYILVYKYARFGTSKALPIPLYKGQAPKDVPKVLGRFLFSEGHFFIENLSPDYANFSVNGICPKAKDAFPLIPESKIQIDDLKITVIVE